jgi:hypothetical protein
MVNYIRQFIPSYAALAKDLYTLSSKEVLQWEEDSDTAFMRIKQAISSATLLHHLNYKKRIVLRTDASLKGVGGALVNIGDDGEEAVVTYFSKAFNEVQTRWSTIEQECFALVYGVVINQHHLRGVHFEIETDHRNLKWLNHSQVPKLVRWGLQLAEFDFDVCHIPGKDNVVADGLSRLLPMSSASRSEETVAAVVEEHEEVEWMMMRC